MGERSSHTPGTFSWVDLATSDAAAAKGFYGALFGWEMEDMPVPESGPYTIARVGGRAVAALYERADESVPPAWLSYVTVEDADASAERVAELGGTVVQGPFDVFDAGRMAVLQDATGAVFAVWQPRGTIGAELVNDVGALVHNQLNTSDPEVARPFYEGLFGWRVEAVGNTEQPYWGLYNGDRVNGGMMPLPPGGGQPSHWLAYFTAADIDDSVERIRGLGGAILVEPMEIPSGGRVAVAADPQGAAFALFEGEVDP